VRVWLAVALGGALGACLRHGCNRWLAAMTPQWPWSTLLVNVLGSLLAGLLYALIVERGLLPASWRPLLLVGLLGALTTFSAFALEAVLLIESGRMLAVVAHVVGNVTLALGAAMAGLTLVRLLP